MFDLPLKMQVFAQYPHDSEQVPFFYGEARVLFLLVLTLHLAQESADRIMRCPECKDIFYRVKSQKYCSRPCANRAGLRNWRTTPKGKKYEAERSRKRYRKQVREKTNANVKVTRRKRNVKTSG